MGKGMLENMKEPYRTIFVVLLTAFVCTTGTYSLTTRYDINKFILEVASVKAEMLQVNKDNSRAEAISKEQREANERQHEQMRVEFNERLIAVTKVANETMKSMQEQSRTFTSLIELLKDRQQRINLSPMPKEGWIGLGTNYYNTVHFP